MSNDNSLNSEDIEPVVSTATKTKANKTTTIKRQSTAGTSQKNVDHGENVRKSVTNTKKRKN